MAWSTNRIRSSAVAASRARARYDSFEAASQPSLGQRLAEDGDAGVGVDLAAVEQHQGGIEQVPGEAGPLLAVEGQSGRRSCRRGSDRRRRGPAVPVGSTSARAAATWASRYELDSSGTRL